jgi:hypothetical protein
MVAESAGRRFFRASPATWATVLGGLLAVSAVAMLPLTLMAHQVFGGLVALVVGVACAGVGVIVARDSRATRSGGSSWSSLPA